MDNLLQQKVDRYNELQTLLSDKNVIGDSSLYAKYAKEFAHLEPLVKKYARIKKIEHDYADLKAVLEKGNHDAEFLKLAEEELETLAQERRSLEDEIVNSLLDDDPDAGRNIIMEIRAGTGGQEASLFVGDLYRMYTKYAASLNWKIEPISYSASEAGGFKEIIFSVEGEAVYQRLKYESGVHRVQRVPATEASGRVHTSTATVAVLPEAEEVDMGIDQADLRIDVYRSSGPGGQGVNKIESAVRITHIPTGLVVACQEERSQTKNKAKALKVLRARLLDMERQRQQEKIARDRRAQIGTGERSEKIRTYNFPDRRVTDHRINFTLHTLPEVLNGDLAELIAALRAAERQKKLELKGIRNA